jgi:hypothetical protein
MSKIATSQRERQKKVKEIKLKIPSFNEAYEKLNLPLIQLCAAISRYETGKCDDDSIVHSVFAVEIGLALKLDEKLTQQDKSVYRGQGIFFNRIIKLSKKYGLLNKDYETKARKLNNLRNMFVHPGNWIQYLKDLNIAKIDSDPYFQNMISSDKNIQRNIELRKKEIERSPEKKALLKEIDKKLKEEMKKLNDIPNLNWLARKGTLNFQKEEMKPYFKQVVSNVMSKKGFNTLVKKVSKLDRDKAVKFIQTQYSYLEPTAFDVLNDAFQILSFIGCI